MASTINGTSTGNGGLISTGDDSGILNIQTNETTAITVDASQRAAFVAGTAALPAITTTGDTNTGIFFPAADTIAFSEGGAEAMRIDTSGNVGIGNTSPVAKLDVENTSAKPFGTAAQLNAIFKGSVSIGEGGAIGFDYFGSHTNCPTSIGYAVESQAGSTNGSLVFGTRSVTTDTAPTERMRIVSSGELVVGGTTAGGVGTSIAAPDSGGIYLNTATTGLRNAIRFVNPNGTVGSIQTNGSATAYNTSSDYRLKENIAPMTGALAKVALLKPVTYKWKVDGAIGEGFIAHELAEVCSHAVSGAKDAVDENGNPEYQGIDVSFLVATLTAAIQELKAINDTQAATINALTARIVALETA